MWLKLTKLDGEKIIINFDRFETMEMSSEGFTRITSLISDDEFFTIDVKESMKEIHEWLSSARLRGEE